jgi:hypothetical protein
VTIYWKAEDGEVVRDREVEEEQQKLNAAWRRIDEREAWRLALTAPRLARYVRPLIRVRLHVRAPRARRAVLRRSPARSPGPREPEPPSRPSEATA